LKSQPECKKLKLKSKLIRWSKKPKDLFKKDKLRMNLLQKKKEKNSIIYKLSASQSSHLDKLKLKQRLFLSN
jgi:hypothetical protein